MSRYAGHETRQVFNLHTQAMEEIGLGLKHAATEEEIWHKMRWMRPTESKSAIPNAIEAAMTQQQISATGEMDKDPIDFALQYSEP